MGVRERRMIMKAPWERLDTCRNNIDRYTYYLCVMGYDCDCCTVFEHENGKSTIDKTWIVTPGGKRVPQTTIFSSYISDVYEQTDYTSFKEAKADLLEELKTWKW